MVGIDGKRRLRVCGILSRGNRGLIIRTDEDEVWVLDQHEIDNSLLETRVVVEGTTVGLDRLHAYWIGPNQKG